MLEASSQLDAPCLLLTMAFLPQLTAIDPVEHLVALYRSPQ